MEDLEDTVLAKLPFQVPFYERFVDDIIIAIPENENETTKKAFNSYSRSIQFTVEDEANGSISFLDFTLTRLTNGKIETKWYQKSVASGRYLNFQANNPMAHKRNVITAVTDRAIRFTNPKDRPESLAKVRDMMGNNGYPDGFVSDIIKKRVDRFYNGKDQKNTTKKKFIPTTYVPGLSERLKKSLNQHDLNISCKATNTIGNIYSRMKYAIPKDNKSKVIYSVKCDVCGTTYVGMTKQKLKDRMAKHRSDVHLRKTRETTGLTIHAVTENHTFDFKNVTILDQIPNFFQRCIAEKMYIHKTPNNCNTQVDKQGLHKSYINLLKIHSKPRIRPPNTSTTRISDPSQPT